MNSDTSSDESARPGAMPGKTLQAILQSSDGTMDSVAVPVPLPDVILRVQDTHAEIIFRRAKSSDSVLRYVEDRETALSTGADIVTRRCGGCQGARSLYFVPKLAPQEALTSRVVGYCVDCYGSASP
jgi:hypothetical protein